jgi:predicted dehydrogenase
MYAPMLAAGPETRLTAVYARRSDAATELADAFGAVGTDNFDDIRNGPVGQLRRSARRCSLG